jgi:uncharacterized protein YbjT (DUF2867 family)
MILITGATGNVGRPLVTKLLARGAKSAPSAGIQTPLVCRTEPKSSRPTRAGQTH